MGKKVTCRIVFEIGVLRLCGLLHQKPVKSDSKVDKGEFDKTCPELL